jgi:4'-phosphopantetheinyl transferase
LADQEIHVWRAWLDELASDLPAFAETLSASERNRAERFQFERDRNRFIVRRGLLRGILGRYLNLDPARLSFTYESRGKPTLAGSMDAPTIHFNLSHSEGLALFGVTRSAPFGIDLERVRPMPDPDQIAAKFFSARENVVLNALPAEQRIEGFFNCWTRKEAYLKATGQGIADALPEVEVSLTPGQPAQLLSVAGDAQEASLWSFYALAPAPGYIGALAAKARGLKLVCWQWPGHLPALAAGR